MLFCSFEVAIFVKLLSDSQMGFLEQIASIFGDQSDHVVILSALLVHGNSQIVFFDN
jgi:hypothetical protein